MGISQCFTVHFGNTGASESKTGYTQQNIYIYFIAKDVYKIKRNVVAMHTYTFTALTSFRFHCEMKLASKRVTIRLSDKSLGICISYDSSRGNDKSVWYGDYADGIGGQCSRYRGRVFNDTCLLVCKRTSCCAIPSLAMPGKHAINSRRSLPWLEPCTR